MSTKKLEEKITALEENLANSGERETKLREQVAELLSTNADLQKIIDARNEEIFQLGGENEKLLSQVEELSQGILAERSANDDPGAERETKAERQKRLLGRDAD